MPVICSPRASGSSEMLRTTDTQAGSQRRTLVSQGLHLLRLLRLKQSTFSGGSSITIALNGSAVVLYGLGSILVARAIGPEETGKLAWFVAGTATVALFSDVAGIYYSSALHAARRSGGFTPRQVHGSVVAYGVACGVFAALVVSAVLPFRVLIFKGLAPGAWSILIFLNIVGGALVNQFRGLFWGRSQFLLLGALGLARWGGYSMLAVAGALLLGWQEGAQIALMQVVATWTCVLGSAAYFAARGGGIGRPSLNFLKSIARQGLRGAGLSWITYLHLRVDQFLVNVMLGARELGLYAVAVSLGEVITQIPGMLGMVVFPAAAGTQDPVEEGRRTVRRSLWVTGITAAALLPVFVLSSWLVNVLYGAAFSGSAALLQAYLPAVVFLSGLLLLNNHVSGLGYPAPQLWLAGIALLLNVVMNLVLIAKVGVLGAPLSSSITYAVWFATMFAYLQRRTRTTVNVQPLPQHVGISE